MSCPTTSPLKPLHLLMPQKRILCQHPILAKQREEVKRREEEAYIQYISADSDRDASGLKIWTESNERSRNVFLNELSSG